MKKFKISKIFKKKKKKKNSSIKFFQIPSKIQDFQNFQKKKRRKFSKKALGLGALGSYFLGCFKRKKKINQNFQFHEKNSRFLNFSKKKIQNFQFLQKIQVLQIQKKKTHTHRRTHKNLH